MSKCGEKMATLEEHQAVLLELLEEFDRVSQKHNISYTLFAGSALGAVRHGGIIPWDDDLDVAMLRDEYERFLKIAPAELTEKYYLQAEGSKHWPLCFSKLRKNNTTYLEKYHPKDTKTHQGIYVDIFPLDNASDNALIRKLQFYASRVAVAKGLWKRGYETNSLKKKVFMAFCCLLPLKPFVKLAMLKKKRDTQCVQSFLACTSRYKKGIYKREWVSKTVEMDFAHLKVPVPAGYDGVLKTLYGDYMRIPSEEERKIKEHAVLIDTERNYTEYEHYRDGMTFDVFTRNIH